MDRSTRTRTAALAGALAALVGLSALSGAAGPATAAAAPAEQQVASSLSGSLVFIKDHDVWLSRPDGSGLYQVTTTGTASSPWRSPTQSDTGVIAASHDRNIVVMGQNGAVRSVIDPAPLPSSVSTGIDGPPLDLAISPDGTKVAYTMYTYGCPIGTECMARTATAVTDVTGLTPYQTYGATYLSTPSWIGNGRTLQSGGNGSHMKLKDLGGSADVVWFNDYDVFEDSTDLGDGEVSPDGRRLAAVRGYGDGTHIIWYDVVGNVTAGAPPAVPQARCVTGELAGLADPTWSPDSAALAWQEPDGLWLKDDAATCTSPQPRLVVPGGSEPDWSASPVAPGPRTGTGGGTGTNLPAGTLVAGTPAVTGKARVGKRLTATTGTWSPAPATYAYQWLRNGKAVRGATAASYKVGRQDRGKRLSVRLTGSLPGYAAQSATSAATRPVKGR